MRRNAAAWECGGGLEEAWGGGGAGEVSCQNHSCRNGKNSWFSTVMTVGDNRANFRCEPKFFCVFLFVLYTLNSSVFRRFRREYSFI